MKISLNTTPVIRGMEAVVFPVFKGKSMPAAFKDFPGLKVLTGRQKFRGNPGESIAYFSTEKNILVIAVGAGKIGSKPVSDAAKCGKTIIKTLQTHKIKKTLLNFQQEAPLSLDFWNNFIDSLYISTYRFNKYLQPDETVYIDQLGLYFLHKSGGKDVSLQLLKQRERINQSVIRTRDLINEPASEANPDTIVDAFKQLTREFPSLKLQVLRKRQLQEQGLQGTLTVGKSSPYEPAMVRIQYIPPDAGMRIGLVGKGVTFDAGGLNIKTGAHMYNMKSDMSGAAAVLGFMSALTALELPVAVDAYVPIAENLIGQHAYKPGDIISYKNGKTVEVVNTDCEGRLLLADALILAAETKPHYIIELSTLTGSVANALGEGIAGLMGNHKRLINKLLKAGNKCNERLWQLPLLEEYKESIKSKIATLKNAGYGRTAGAIKAGLFLEQFVDGLPFAHIDIAGTAFLSRPNDYYLQEGASGFGVRLLVEFIQLCIASEQKKK
jgi:leucyl aminopeptidase